MRKILFTFCKSSHTFVFTIIQQMSLEQFFTDIKDEIERVCTVLMLILIDFV